MSEVDKSAIRDLNYRYALHCDLFHGEEWIDVFSPDGVLDETEFGLGRHAGREGIRTYYEHIEKEVIHQVHLMNNHLVSDMTATTAKGTVFALVEAETRTNGRVRFHVFYEDQYSKIDGEWKIKYRRLHKGLAPEVVSAPAAQPELGI